MAIQRIWDDITIPGLTPFLYGSGSTAPNGKIYFGQGFNNSTYQLTGEWNSLDMSTETPTLSAMSPFPGTNRNAHYQFIIGDKIYLGAGAEVDSLPIYSDWYEYDTVNDMWTQVDDMPAVSGLSGMAAGSTQQAVSMNGYGYVFLGVQVVETVSTDVPWCFRFDPNAGAGNQWTQLPDFPGTPRSDATVMTDGESIFVGFGLDDATTTILDECWLYTNIISEVTLPAYAISNYPLGYGNGQWQGIPFDMTRAFDKDTNLFWLTAYPDGSENSGGNPWWIGQDFGVGNEKCIIRYSITNRPDTELCSPVDFTFEASDTGVWGGEEVILDTQTALTWTTALETKIFNIANTTTYRYYRLNVSLMNGVDYFCGISELNMYVSGYGWEQLTNTVVPARFKAVGIEAPSVGGKGLIVGGLIDVSFGYSTNTYSFDFTTKRFRKEQDYSPTGVDSAVGVRLNNDNIVIISGRNSPTTTKDSISYYHMVAPTLPWIGGYEDRILSTPGLVGYWKFDNNFNDSTGNNLHGVLTGDVTFTTPRVGVKSASFNGGYVSIPNNPLLDVTEALSWEFFLKPNPFSNQGIISKDGLVSEPTNTYMFSADANLFRIRFNYPNFDYTIPLELSVWSHIVITYDREFVKGYVNGVLKLNQAFTEALLTNTNDLVLGCYYSATYPYSGGMDDFSFYNRALDEWEVKAHYASSVEPTTATGNRFYHTRDRKSPRENI